MWASLRIWCRAASLQSDQEELELLTFNYQCFICLKIG